MTFSFLSMVGLHSTPLHFAGHSEPVQLIKPDGSEVPVKAVVTVQEMDGSEGVSGILRAVILLPATVDCAELAIKTTWVIVARHTRFGIVTLSPAAGGYIRATCTAKVGEVTHRNNLRGRL